MGIVVPDPEVMPEWAKKKGILGTYKDLCKNTVGKLLQTFILNDSTANLNVTLMHSVLTGIEEGYP